MADMFQQFGGRALPPPEPTGDQPAKQAPDPFAQFGGKVVAPEPTIETEIPEQLGQNDLQKIAQRHGVSVEDLRDIAPYYGVKLQDTSWGEIPVLAAKEAAGSAGRIALGIPQFLYKKTQDERMQQAIDELQEIGKEHTGLISSVGESIVGGAVKAPASALGRVAQATGVGATIGATESKTGEELEGATKGGALGLAFGVGGEAAGKLIAKIGTSKASKAEQEIVRREIDDLVPELEKGTEEILATRKESEDLILGVINGKAEVDFNNAEKIISQQLPEEEVARLLDPVEEAGALLRKRTASNHPDLVRDLGFERASTIQLAEDLVNQRTLALGKSINPRAKSLEEASEAVVDYVKRQGGEEALANKYKLISEEYAADKYIRDNVIKQTRGDDALSKASNFISDNQFVLRDIDQRYGSNLEPVFSTLNKNINRLSFAKKPFQESIYHIYKEAGKKMDTSAVLTALDTGKGIESLDPVNRKAYEGFRSLFADIREFVNAGVRSKDPSINPLSIPKLEHYLPHIAKPIPDVLNGLEQRMNKLQSAVDSIRELSGAELQQLAGKNPEIRELVNAVKWYSDKSPVVSGRDLLSKYKDLFTREGRTRMDTMARAAMQRHGEMPGWLMESNLFRIADSYLNNTMKHLYLRNPVDRLQSLSRRVERAGGEVEARYVRNLLSDLQGLRKGTFAEKTAGYKTQYLRELSKLEDSAPYLKPAIAAAKAVPDILSDMYRNIYPNLLGLNPKSVLMQLTQPMVKTAPELGNKYGYSTVLRGSIHSLLNMPRQLRKIRDMGFVPEEYTRKFFRPTAEGIRKSALYAIPTEAANKMGDVSLWLYTKMDLLNRAISLSSAEIMANDLARGSKLAAQSLAKFPKAIQRMVAKSGSEAETAEILGRYLNDVTQYNYNRASMSEYGRTMGPLFSTFSKWPTATAGEIVSEFRDKGILKGSTRVAEKFLGPLALLQAADVLVFGEGAPWMDEKEKSDTLKKIVGPSGLSVASPVAQIPDILTGEFFTPPVIDTLLKGVVIPAMEGEGDKVVKGIDTALKNFTPGSVYLRFLTDDLVTYITGERPEGSTFVEKSLEGAKTLEKKLGK